MHPRSTYGWLLPHKAELAQKHKTEFKGNLKLEFLCKQLKNKK